jgi:hypothetical protein
MVREGAIAIAPSKISDKVLTALTNEVDGPPGIRFVWRNSESLLGARRKAKVN